MCQKGGESDEKTKRIILKLAEKVAEQTLAHNANSTTCFTIYQPRTPKSLEQFKSKYHDFQISTKNNK